MKKSIVHNVFLLTAAVLLFTMCTKTTSENPFLAPLSTPHETAPFDKIKLEHYEPALMEGIRQHDEEINQIVENPEPATFANTIVPLDYSGRLLEFVSNVLGNLNEAETCDEMQELVLRLMPLLTEHSNNITLNADLFARVKTVYDTADRSALTIEEQRLLDNTYRSFVRSGANLGEADKETYRQLTNDLSQATLLFNQNHLKATNSYRLNITDSTRLRGLPETALDMAAEEAATHEETGWTFTLQAPSYIPVMTYCEDRDLRKELNMAYNTQAISGENSNIEVVRTIVNLRLALAKLLGFDTFADYMLEDRMAENMTNVNQMYDQLLTAYLPAARQEVEAVAEQARAEQGDDFELMPWDFSFYAERLRKAKYNFDEEMLRPYFKLENVIDGVFGLATKLYGITFNENKSIPVYHPDVKAYEVCDADGTFLAVLYADFFPRDGKNAGAWMTSYKGQWLNADGSDSRPHVSITTNFTKPTANKPALLTYDEVETFLHEFGHSLHGIFAATHYPSMCSPNVAWDFVEMPSQIMENFGTEKEFLHTFARHFETGELIPDNLVESLVRAKNYNAAYACMRQVSFGLLDMAWYTRTEPFEGDVIAYEKEAFAPTQLLPSQPETCMTVQFGHIMAGGYAAGYYSYKWAEMLDADAFSVFAADGVISPAVAKRFRNDILSKGDSEHPMTLFKAFRGQEPTIDAMLQRDGILAVCGDDSASKN